MGSSPGKSVNKSRTSKDYACIEVKPAPSDEEEFHYFTSGVLSLSHPSQFRTNDGIIFSSLEQFMMFNKAALFKDKATCDKVLLATSQDELEALFERIDNFDPQIWFEHKTRILWNGTMFKFSQNNDLLAALFRTYPKILVYACATDTVMGIGMTSENPRSCEIDNWRGYNILGMVLTGVREELMCNNKRLDVRCKQFSLETIEKLYEHAIQEVLAATHVPVRLRPFTARKRNLSRMRERALLDDTTAGETEDTSIYDTSDNWADDQDLSGEHVDFLNNIEDIGEPSDGENNEKKFETDKTDFKADDCLDSKRDINETETQERFRYTNCDYEKQNAASNIEDDKTPRVYSANGSMDLTTCKDLDAESPERVIGASVLGTNSSTGHRKSSMESVGINNVTYKKTPKRVESISISSREEDVESASKREEDDKELENGDRLSITSKLSSPSTGDPVPTGDVKDFWDVVSLGDEDFNVDSSNY